MDRTEEPKLNDFRNNVSGIVIGYKIKQKLPIFPDYAKSPKVLQKEKVYDYN